jgi:hypothetical protein
MITVAEASQNAAIVAMGIPHPPVLIFYSCDEEKGRVQYTYFYLESKFPKKNPHIQALFTINQTQCDTAYESTKLAANGKSSTVMPPNRHRKPNQRLPDAF